MITLRRTVDVSRDNANGFAARSIGTEVRLDFDVDKAVLDDVSQYRQRCSLRIPGKRLLKAWFKHCVGQRAAFSARVHSINAYAVVNFDACEVEANPPWREASRWSNCGRTCSLGKFARGIRFHGQEQYTSMRAHFLMSEPRGCCISILTSETEFSRTTKSIQPLAPKMSIGSLRMLRGCLPGSLVPRRLY
jgi:hypothetical protein